MAELSFNHYKRIIEGLIMAADQPLNIDQILKIFDPDSGLNHQEIKKILIMIAEEYQGRSVELKEVASGYRFQVVQDLSPWIQKLWQEKPAKYSRALLETLALIVYRQPITRAEIEDIRGVAVSSTIIKTLLEREWIKIIGHKELPGKPALYGTTKQFLNDLGLKSLSELPPLAELADMDEIESKLEIQLQLPVAPSESATKQLESEVNTVDQADE